MSFRMVDIPDTFKVDVRVRIPGVKSQKTLQAEFNMISDEEIEELNGLPAEQQDEKFVKDVLVGLHGVRDESDEKVDPDVAKTLMKYPFVRKPVTTAFFKAMSGSDPRLGN
ncbi:MAG: hypothetical protein OQJ95_10070 [Kangiella sp.]|nr:hypothetical protein [Kangiella sp.]MCW9029667.1 hypothetical protein [Kangiella sp.]